MVKDFEDIGNAVFSRITSKPQLSTQPLPCHRILNRILKGNGKVRDGTGGNREGESIFNMRGRSSAG